MKKKRRILALILLIVMVATIAASSLRVFAAELTVTNFNSHRYADDYADLKEAFGYDHYALWNHYIKYGASERRIVYTTGGEVGLVSQAAVSSATFDSKRYADDYPDLKRAFGYNHAALWNHYIVYGRTENRKVYTIAGEGQNPSYTPVEASMESQFAQLMLASFNAERAKAGVPALSLADDATAAARVRGTDFLKLRADGVTLTQLPHMREDGSSFTSAYAVRTPTRYGENTLYTYWMSYDDIASFAARCQTSFTTNSNHYMQMISPIYASVGFYPTYVQEYGAASWYIVVAEFHN